MAVAGAPAVAAARLAPAWSSGAALVGAGVPGVRLGLVLALAPFVDVRGRGVVDGARGRSCGLAFGVGLAAELERGAKNGEVLRPLAAARPGCCQRVG